MYACVYEPLRFEGKYMTASRIQKLEKIFKAEGPIVRSSTLRAAKFCSKDVAELAQRGLLRQIRRGYYAWAPMADSLNALEVIASLVPDGIVSLFSAAQYHDLTTVIPQSIEITLPSTMRTPVFPGNLSVKIYKSENYIYQVGIKTVKMDHFAIKIYDRERTVCDFIRMRLKIGKDVALEVLKNYMAGRKNLQKLYEYAKLLQVEGVIHPYLEALV
jgi:predicted transcriptional regulator of viral defense system